jgi:ribosomal-protein-alanine N-acetyltransferase
MESFVQIRPMRAEDIPQVHAIDQKSFTMPWSERSYRYELNSNPASFLWVAEYLPDDPKKSKVVGLIVVWLVVDEAHIATIAVDPDFRRRAIGRRLLNTALFTSWRKGMLRATLEVRAGNLIAQNLYRSLGFTEVGRRYHYYRDNNEDALLLTVALNEALIRKMETRKIFQV